MKAWKVAVLVGATAGGLAGGALLVASELVPEGIPAEADATERAMALDDLVGIATLAVSDLAEIESALHGEGSGDDLPTPPSEEPEGVEGVLKRAGLDLRHDIDHVTLAAYEREQQGAYAMAVFGRFEPERWLRALGDAPEFRVEQRGLAGEPAYEVSWLDPESCAPRGPWGLHLSRDRILVATPARLAQLVERLAQAAPAGRDLSSFQAYREGQLASLALFVPDELPADIEHPFARMPAEMLRAEIEDFRALYLRAGVSLLPPGARLGGMLEAPDAATAERTAARWRSAIDTFRSGVAEKMPTLASLVDDLEVASDRAVLRAEVHIDRGTLERIEAIPAELLGLLFGGVAQGFATAEAEEEPEEELLDSEPAVFKASYTPSSLPDYDPDQLFAGPVDLRAGPFGIRVASLALGTPERGSELGIEALGTGVRNLGDKASRARLFVSSVRDASGDELLAVEVCGSDRNDRPARFEEGFGSKLIKATKTVRLRPEVDAARARSISGEVRLLLPVRTESVVLDAPKAGDSAERAGARVELTEVGPRSFSYRVSGLPDRVLLLRALNARRKPLVQESSSRSTGWGPVSGSIQWAGRVEHVELVFATEEEELAFPFELEGVRPGTDGQRLLVDGEMPRFAGASLDQVLRQLGDAIERVLAAEAGVSGPANAGPFHVVLEGMWPFGGLMPNFEIYAPEIPDLEHTLGGLEIALERITLADGSVTTERDVRSESAFGGVDPKWTEPVSLSKAWSGEGLRGNAGLATGAQVDAEQVKRLEGTLTLRMPRRIATLSLLQVELGRSASGAGVTLTLQQLARDAFTLRAEGESERIVGVRAFNAEGEELASSSAQIERDGEGWLGTFGVQGVPQRIDVLVAPELDRRDFPYSLEL